MKKPERLPKVELRAGKQNLKISSFKVKQSN
jgi:hypothetical protein